MATRRKHHDVLPIAGIPLYVKVRESLRATLLELEPGTLIPPEPALCEQFAVSRITLRKAIDDLVAENLLVRQQGRGTFRAKPRLIHELNSITSWTEQLKALGYKAGTAERAIEEVRAPRQVAAALQIGESEPVVVMRRLRMANNEPITHMVNYLPSALVPGFQEVMERAESLYQVLRERYGLIATHATDTVASRPAMDMESERLRLEPWAPVLAVTRVAYLESGRPFEIATAISRGDRFEYRVQLFRGRTGAF